MVDNNILLSVFMFNLLLGTWYGLNIFCNHKL